MHSLPRPLVRVMHNMFTMIVLRSLCSLQGGLAKGCLHPTKHSALHRVSQDLSFRLALTQTFGTTACRSPQISAARAIGPFLLETRTAQWIYLSDPLISPLGRKSEYTRGYVTSRTHARQIQSPSTQEQNSP